jgi:hypothetical protein
MSKDNWGPDLNVGVGGWNWHHVSKGSRESCYRFHSAQVRTAHFGISGFWGLFGGFFFGVIGVWTRGLILARQAFYHLSHAPSPQALPSWVKWCLFGDQPLTCTVFSSILTRCQQHNSSKCENQNVSRHAQKTPGEAKSPLVEKHCSQKRQGDENREEETVSPAWVIWILPATAGSQRKGFLPRGSSLFMIQDAYV